MSEAYRVVHRTADPHVFRSVYARTLYPVGEEVVIQHGGGLVFPVLRHAMQFANMHEVTYFSLAVFRCEVEGRVLLPPYRLEAGGLSEGDVEEFWRLAFSGAWEQSQKLSVQIGWPEGTWAFSRIRLIEEVER